MQGINYRNVALRRLDNYNYLRHKLGGRQLLYEEVPMIYPFETELGQNLRKKLIANKVFVAKYWSNVDEWAGEEAMETWMANHILPLPIDQRYDEEDMKRIVDLIKK